MRSIIVFAIVVLGNCVVLGAQQKRTITPADCVTVRYLKSGPSYEPRSISVSPDGKLIAYLVKSPNIKNNENDIELYVKNISPVASVTEKPIAVGQFSGLRWLGDSQHVLVLAKEGDKHIIKKIDVNSGTNVTLIEIDSDTDEYASDSKGDVIVFVVTMPPPGIGGVTQNEIASGYRIPFRSIAEAQWPQKQLFVTKYKEGGWTAPQQIYIESPLEHRRLSNLTSDGGTLRLSLSPDGEELALQYVQHSVSLNSLPERWRKSAFVQWQAKRNFPFGLSLSVIYHLRSGATTMPFESPFATSISLWSSDSHSFVVFGWPPVSSDWEKREAERGPSVLEHGRNASMLYWVQPDTGKVELVASHEQAPYYPFPAPLYWKDDSLLVGDLDKTVTRLSRRNGHWELGQSVKLAVQGAVYFVSNGVYAIGEMQAATTPPALVIEQLGDPKVEIFAKLNPQFDQLALASVKTVSWQTSTGRNVDGFLFLPPNQAENSASPLVIQTKPYSGNWFACDYGAAHFPSFEPQPLASAGIAYLAFYFPDNHDGKGLEAYYPKGYPGHIAEEIFMTDVYDSAVKDLAARGLIDSKKVGIIGFSSTGYDVEFALMHGRTRYRAATVVDNVEYSFSEYALGPLMGTSSESTTWRYGGPPYGSTLKNWTDYSVSFNVDKIHTPLLMEEMGYGRLFDHPRSPPINITKSFELFTGLNFLHKAVEYYYYPNEGHEPDDPQARLANLQRNLDWYRFWLQGYARPKPEDAEQYVRWSKLRKEQDEEEAKDPAAAAIIN